MIPSGIEILDALPVNANGKVHRAALPEPKRTRFEQKESYVAPMGAMQKQIAAIWSEVLDLEEVGLEDNFFEIGGQSIAAMKIIARIRVEFSRTIPVSAVFGNPTIRLLSEIILNKT